MPTMTIDRVSKRYGRDRWALRDVSLHLEPGVFGLVGPNGAGKTTLLRMLATLLTPTEGLLTWNGQDVIRHPQLVRQVLGYLPQEFGAYPQLTARELLRYLGELKGLRGPLLQRRVAASLEAVRLQGEADRRLREFSGGMLRRVGIAQALLNEPQVLVLDEPTAGLDPAERRRFREVFAALPGERVVILSTHIITDIEAMASQFALLSGGRVLWAGTPDGLIADAEGSTWSLTLTSAEFERLRTSYRASAAVRHGEWVEARLLASASPHPSALPVTPTLEEAYLFFIEKNDLPPIT